MAAIVKSNLEAGLVDILLRSRATILDILDERGYDTTIYRNIAPEQILTLAEGNTRALDIIVPKRADSQAPAERAVVVYQFQDRIQKRLGTWLTSEEGLGGGEIRPTDDIIVLINEPYHEAFDKAALSAWQERRQRVVFFHIKQVVVNPSKHVLVPPHRKLTPEEAKVEMDRLHITQKSQLPLIKHHDIQSRVMGLVPGDLVEILRPSPTAGVARVLRICAA